MDLRPDSSRTLLEAARALAPQIEAASDQSEQERRLSPALVAALVDAGLFRMIVPRSLGGSEVPLPVFAEVIEEVAKADASTAWCLAQNAGICRVSAYLANGAAREIFGQPELIVAWGQGTATAVRVDGGYRLTGQWSFVSGVRHATWLGCQNCGVVGEDGQPTLAKNGEPERCILLFPAAEAEILDVWQVSGLRGTGSDGFLVKDLFVPQERSPREHCQEPGPLYVFGTTNIFSVGFASVALGLARATLDAFLDLAVTKTPRSLTGVLRERPTVQVRVAQAEATLRSARAFLLQTVGDAWQAVSETRELTLETRILLRLATTYAIQQAAQVVDTAYYAAGATAIFNVNPFERRFRDLHAVTQHIQAREDHFESIGQFFLGLDPDRQWL